MADFQIPNDLEYESRIRKLETTDRAHANVFNTLFQKIINNVAFLKRKVDKKIVFGARDTPLEVGSTLFVIEDWVEPEPPRKFEGAYYSNVDFRTDEAVGFPHWGKLEGIGKETTTSLQEIEEKNIISGKLVVSEEASSDATFFAKINK